MSMRQEFWLHEKLIKVLSFFDDEIEFLGTNDQKEKFRYSFRDNLIRVYSESSVREYTFFLTEHDSEVFFSFFCHKTGKNFFNIKIEKDYEKRSTSSDSNVKKKKILKSQMPGKIVKVFVQEGQKIEKGQTICVLEAMKMENEIQAPLSGVVQSLKVVEAQAVDVGVVIAEIQEA